MEGKFETIEANLDQALELASNWHHLYLCSKPKERRLMNQAIFEPLYILPDETIEHEFAAPFATLLGDDLQRAVTLHRAQKQGWRHGDELDARWAELSAKWAAEATDCEVLTP